MTDKVIIGCDISKNKLDFYCQVTNEYFILPNDETGMEKLKKWIDHHQFNLQNLYISFEHTGIYANLLECFCNTHSFTYFKLVPLEIKRSLGVIRGKNDKVDSKRIHDYVIEKFNKLTPTKPAESAITELKRLTSYRSLLVGQRASLVRTSSESKKVLKLTDKDFIIKSQLEMIKKFDKQIKNVETQIQNQINHSKAINKNYKLLLTIVGVGPVTAIELIIVTANFTRFENWRKFASYCGCAPFSNQSGNKVGKMKLAI
jgi:transposase